MDQKTILNELHRASGARMVPFGGWDMPLHYGSQIEEHHAVRQAAGMFDVSHMTAVDIVGEQATDYLRHLLANDVAKLTTPGKALYSCMLRDDGGVIDDLIVYGLDPHSYRIVINAATTAKDLAWMSARADGFAVSVKPRRDLALIAVQGPQARDLAAPLLPGTLRPAVAGLTPFQAAAEGDWLVGRTGYTGEDGLELMLPGAQAPALWQALAAAGVRPCGLGARDTLRLEAGMNLYGQDMDETVSPLACGLAWTLAFTAERDFVGRAALLAQREAGGLPRFIGLVMDGRGILRGHQTVFDGDHAVGELTSGGFSPTLQRSIALARVDAAAGETLSVEVRGKRQPVRRVKPPFVRHGQACIDL